MNYFFSSGEDLLSICRAEGITIGEAMIRREVLRGEMTRSDIIDEMSKNLATMRTSIKEGIEVHQSSVSGLTGEDAERLYRYKSRALMGERMARIVASSMAVVEVNASMGKIVAAPTAGSSGILPSTLIVCGEERGWDDSALILGLFTASAIGLIIADKATTAGAVGGCQAETGTAAAMAAAALTELSGGTPHMALDAAAIALKNIMGLVCDPVAGLVECPCIKRNAIGAANAVLSADLALSGITSLIPFDECVAAMKSVGKAMNADLRETARGGLAATPTAKRIAKQLGLAQTE